MSFHHGYRKDFLQRGYQVEQRPLLRFGTCIGRFALGSQATFVADANRVKVEALCVGTDSVQPSGVMHQPIRFDVEVIADAVEPALLVADFQHIGIEGNIAARCAAMDYD